MAMIKLKTDPESGKNISIEITPCGTQIITATNLSIVETKKHLMIIGADQILKNLLRINELKEG